jgi:DNA repair exonuclease SbcCD nuclease subunit
MKPVKILHTSDLHIDWPFDKFIGASREQRRRDLFAAFEELCSLAIAVQADVLLVAGDLFHSDQVDRSTAALVISGLSKLGEHGVKVVILPGNHDPGIAGVLRKNAGLPANVFVFAGDDWQLFNEIEGVAIYGHPFTESKKGVRVLPELEINNQLTDFTVGILHGTVSGLPQAENDYFPITPKDIAECGLDYLALGHFHNYQDCSSGQTISYYPGSPERLSFNNTVDRKAVLVTLDDSGVNAQPLSLMARPYQVVDVDFNKGELPEIFNYIQRYADNNAVARFNLTGLIEEEDVLTIAKLEQHFKNSFFHLEVSDNTVIMPTGDLADRTVKGVFIGKILARLHNQKTNPEEKKVLIEALKIGLTVLEGGKPW